jgi:long-chain acyl-CoA synthetase
MRETLRSLLDDYAGRGAATAFAHQSGLRVVRWSYARLAQAAWQTARWLESLGVGKGDRVLIWAENSPEWVAAFFGCLLRGAIVVPLDVQSTPDFVARVEQQVTAKLLLHGRGELHDSKLNLPKLRLADLSQLIAAQSAAPYQAPRIEPTDIVEIIYTSGTTAEPKGVVLTHRNLLANLAPLEREIKKYRQWERLVHPLRFLNLVPLSHVFGQFMGIFVPQLLGAEVFLQADLRPRELMQNVRRERINCVVAVPRLLDTLREAIARDQAARGRADEFARRLATSAGWSWLRRWWVFRAVHRRFGWRCWAFIVGGAPLAADTETFWRRLGFAIVQGYGMTETAALVSVNHPFKQARGSIGRHFAQQEVKLDEHGEIMVRGANVSPGYWRGAGVEPLQNEQGWLRTGDVGALDASGHLYFKGRKKETIVTAAGLNVYPADLEAALDRQPEVRASVVVGIEGAQGAEPVAVLVLRDAAADPAEIVRRANETLAPHQQMRRWFVWPQHDFPRTATQKVRWHEVVAAIKTHLTDAPTSGGAAPTDELTQVIGQIIGASAPMQLAPSADLTTALKLDSLGRVALLSALEERFQIDIDEAAFTNATTLGEVEQLISTGTSTAPPVQYPRTAWAQRFPITWLRLVAFYLLLRPLTRLMCPARVRGREHLRALAGPALFVANHVTMVDQSLILAALPGRFSRRVAIAMDGELLRAWRYPPTGTSLFMRLRLRVQYALVVALFNVFPLPQHSGFRRSFAFAGATMDRGYSVLVFPEGKRTQDGRLNPFMAGTGLLATNLRAPVVPIRLDGLFALKQRGRHTARPGEVSVTIGAPLEFAADADPAHITRELEKRVVASEFMAT